MEKYDAVFFLLSSSDTDRSVHYTRRGSSRAKLKCYIPLGALERMKTLAVILA